MHGKRLFFLFALLAALGGTTVGAGASARSRSKEVRYGDYAIKVPASWPVYDLAAHPSRCVRFDRHAVYLGPPRANQRCPAHAVGHTDTISIEPLKDAASQTNQPATVRSGRGEVTPPAFPPASAAEIRFAVPAAGVLVDATWRGDRGRIRSILDRARHVDGPAIPSSSTPASQAKAATGHFSTRSAPAPYFTGLGFDACAAPSSSALSAWSSSPYRAVGIYIGGANRACSQPNLSAGWIGGVLGAGWRVIPIYVGLQAPGAGCGCATIRAGHVRAQGKSAARNAVGDARSLDLGSGAPIYFDLEPYPRGGSNSSRVLRFLSGWTSKLHRLGYVSGVYSSAGSGISDLVSRYRSRYREPDDVWIADWNGERTARDPHVPDGFWSNHQRLHQYRGGHTETHGGVSINIDNDYLDGAAVGGADIDHDHVQDASDLCRTVPGPIQNFGCPYPSYMSGELKAYYDFVKGDRHHGDRYATTTGLSAAYRFRAHLGFLFPVSQPGTVPLRSCKSGRDHFLSLARGCGGHDLVARLGYLYRSQPDGIPTIEIRACRRPDGERFASASPDCGNPRNTNEGPLGFTIATAPLVSYKGNDARGGDLYATTAGVVAAYRFRRNLGMLYQSSQPDTMPLYSCRAGGDHFLSTASNCDGDQVVARLGFTYSSQPAGIPTRAIFSCQLAGGERTVSYDATCGGPPGVNEGSLGFTISTLPLGSYKDSVKGDRSYGDRYATTTGVSAAYRFQRNLGFLYSTSEPGTTPLYSCRVGHDRFLSVASDCEGGTAVGSVGFAYPSKPVGIPTHAIFACHQPSGERFVFSSSSCGGPRNTSQGILGYVLVSPLS